MICPLDFTGVWLRSIRVTHLAWIGSGCIGDRIIIKAGGGIDRPAEFMRAGGQCLTFRKTCDLDDGLTVGCAAGPGWE